MKRVSHHPQEDRAGKRYWRGLEELSNTPEFQEWLQREFPAGAAELETDGVSRRHFVRLRGAAGSRWSQPLSKAARQNLKGTLSLRRAMAVPIHLLKPQF